MSSVSGRGKIKTLVKNAWFTGFIGLMIFLNMIAMGLEYHGQSEEYAACLKISYNIFTVIFALEMLLKVYGLSLYGYISDYMNGIDGVIVILSILDATTMVGYNFTILRAIRILRAVHIIRYLPGLKKQIDVMSVISGEAAAFGGVMAIFIFIASLIGMTLFGHRLCFQSDFEAACSCEDRLNDTIPCFCARNNFDTFGQAILTVFQILTLDGWQTLMFRTMHLVGPWSSVYFIVTITIGNFILISLFVALLVAGYNSPTEIDSFTDLNWNKLDIVSTSWIMENSKLTCETKETLEMSMLGDKVKMFNDYWEAICDQTRMTRLQDENDENPKRKKFVDNEQSCLSKLWSSTFFYTRKDYSLYIFAPFDRFRTWCTKLESHGIFAGFIVVVIMASTILIVVEPSLNLNSLEYAILTYINYGITGIFSTEMILKTISQGLICNTGAYLRSCWNIIDATLVVVGLASIVLEIMDHQRSDMLNAIKILRLLRTLRPLRFIRKAKGLRTTAISMVSSVKDIANLSLIIFVFHTVLAIFGMQFFKGAFYQCEGPYVENVTNRWECESDTRNQWKNAKHNFDNIAEAYLSVLIIATMNGWMDLMYKGIDAVESDIQPIAENNKWNTLYFVSIILIIGFFFLNMLVGILVNQYNQTQCKMRLEKLKRDPYSLIPKKRKATINVLQPAIQKFPIRHYIFAVFYSRAFSVFMIIVIMVNIALMALEHHMMNPDVKFRFDICYLVLTLCFGIEAFGKISAVTVKEYANNNWNKLDFLILILSIAGNIADLTMRDTHLIINPSVLRLIRTIKVIRGLLLCCKLMKWARGLRALMNTLIKAVSDVFNICLLFCILLIIFSALGVELFGSMDCNDHKCTALGEHMTFQSFPSALFALFLVATSDQWNSIMQDTMVSNCWNATGCKFNCCTSNVTSAIYFSTFVLLSRFIVFNIVVAMMMNGFEEKAKEEGLVRITLKEQLERIVVHNRWAK